MKPRTWLLGILAVVLALVGALTLPTRETRAQVIIGPFIYAGSVTVAGAPAPDGHVLTAKILDYESAPVDITGGNYVALLVLPPDTTYDQKTISFDLDGSVQADQTDTFEVGGFPTIKPSFDLSFPNLPLLPTPTVTRTPEVALPSVYSGLIAAVGAEIPEGAELVARIGIYASAPVPVVDGQYIDLLVDPGDISFVGQTIEFFLDGVKSRTTEVYEGGAIRSLDLIFLDLPTATPLAATPTPIQTPTSISTPTLPPSPTLTPMPTSTPIPPPSPTPTPTAMPAVSPTPKPLAAETIVQDKEAAGAALAEAAESDVNTAAIAIVAAAETDAKATGAAIVAAVEAEPEAVEAIGEAMAVAAEINADAVGNAWAAAAESDEDATGEVLAAAAEANADATGGALAVAAETNVDATGGALVASSKKNARATSGALGSSARKNPGAVGLALAAGPAKDMESLALLGDQIPVEPWVPERVPVAGPDPTGEGVLQEVGSSAPIETILAKFGAALPNAHVAVLDVPELPSGVSQLPTERIVNAYLTLTPENFQNEDVVTAHTTLFVEKSWLEANQVHQWSIQFSRFDEERAAWTPSQAKRVREDEERVYFSVVVPGFSLWAISGGKDIPPVEFRADGLTISPAQVQEGQPVTVQVQVTNLTDQATDYNAALWLNSQIHSNNSVAIGAGQTVSVTFEARPTAGDYDVRVDRLLGSFTVQAAVPAVGAATPAAPLAPKAEEAGGAIVIVIAVVVVVGVVVIALAVFFLRRRGGAPPEAPMGPPEPPSEPSEEAPVEELPEAPPTEPSMETPEEEPPEGARERLEPPAPPAEPTDEEPAEEPTQETRERLEPPGGPTSAFDESFEEAQERLRRLHPPTEPSGPPTGPPDETAGPLDSSAEPTEESTDRPEESRDRDIT